VNTARAHSRPADCLSDLQLDQLLVEALPASARGDAVRHVEGCARCSERLKSFANFSLPPVAAIPRARPRGPSRQWLYAAAACLPVLALALVLTHSNTQSSRATIAGEHERTKGSVTLLVAARRAAGDVERLTPLDTVYPGDSLRFEVATSQSGYLTVLSFDSAGVISPYAPFSGSSSYFPAGPPSFLNETVEADATIGAERIVALLCAQPRTVDELKALAARALARAGGDPRRVNRVEPTCAETWFDIEKQARP
jgi:hypothetical protein